MIWKFQNISYHRITDKIKLKNISYHHITDKTDFWNITYHRITDTDSDKFMIVIRCDNDSDKIVILSSNITPQKIFSCLFLCWITTSTNLFRDWRVFLGRDLPMYDYFFKTLFARTYPCGIVSHLYRHIVKDRSYQKFHFH